jgi:hypothetical protein
MNGALAERVSVGGESGVTSMEDAATEFDLPSRLD